MNDLSIVVQEYFQIRVETFLKIVGKKIFGIDHYWIRYEFAPSRGQIHAHLLAICSQCKLLTEYFALKEDKTAQAKYVAEWAKGTFGLTAEINKEEKEWPIHPCSVRFQDTLNKENDINTLLSCLQMHKCNAYCISDRGNKGLKR